jgi:hypothetical protein
MNKLIKQKYKYNHRKGEAFTNISGKEQVLCFAGKIYKYFRKYNFLESVIYCYAFFPIG